MSRAGRPNKNKQFLLNRLQDMYGENFDPILRASERAIELENHIQDVEDKDRLAALKSCIDAWLKIGEYVQPKLKAVEHTGQITTSEAPKSKEELESILQEKGVDPSVIPLQ